MSTGGNLRKERDDDGRDGKWRKDFDEYLRIERYGFANCLKDDRYLWRLGRWFPELDVQDTLHKAHEYFRSYEGWKERSKRQGNRYKYLDWPQVFRGAFKRERFMVWKTKKERDEIRRGWGEKEVEAFKAEVDNFLKEEY